MRRTGDGCTLSDWRIQRQLGNSPICDKRLCDWVVKVGRAARSRTKCEPRDGRSGHSQWLAIPTAMKGPAMVATRARISSTFLRRDIKSITPFSDGAVTVSRRGVSERAACVRAQVLFVARACSDQAAADVTGRIAAPKYSGGPSAVMHGRNFIGGGRC